MLFKIAFSLIVGCRLLALSCSDPVTLSPPEAELGSSAKIIANPRGDFAAYWEINSLEERKVQVAIKPKDNQWLPFTTAAEGKDVSDKACFLDEAGTIDLLFLKGCCGAQTLHRVEKKWGEPWSRVMDFSKTDGDSAIVYTKNMVASVVEGKKGRDNLLAFAFHDKESGQIFYKKIAEVFSIRSDYRSINKQRTVCAVWNQCAKISGWFFEEWKYSLEAAWLKEGMSTPTLETIYTFDKDVWLFSLAMVIDPQENATVVWKTSEGKIQAVSRVAGKWQEPIDVSTPMKGLFNLQVCCDDAGNTLIVWAQREEKKGSIWSAYKPLGGKWSAPVEISLPQGNSIGGAVAHNYAGHFVVVWDFGKKLTIDSVWGATFSTKDQTWTAPQQLSKEGQICGMPSLAFSETGKGFISWKNVTHPLDHKIQTAEIFNP